MNGCICWCRGAAVLATSHGSADNRQILRENGLKAPRIENEGSGSMQSKPLHRPGGVASTPPLIKVAVLPCNVCKAFISAEISTSISSPSHRGFFTPTAGTYAARSYESRDTLHAPLTALRVIEIGPLWLHSCHKQAGTSQSSPSQKNYNKKKISSLNKPVFLSSITQTHTKQLYSWQVLSLPRKRVFTVAAKLHTLQSSRRSAVII